jgi:uncharacterized LabA/DUF88 family protein
MSDVSPFGVRGDERTAIFIDGPNLYSASRQLDLNIDFKAMLAHFLDASKFVHANYYTALSDGEEFSPLRPLVDWLSYNGYTLKTKMMKEYTDETGRKRHKGNMDIEIAVDMMTLAPRLDHVVLFSGDGDFRVLVEAMQAQGVRVTVVSSKEGRNGVIADELRRQANNFVDLADLKDTKFARPITDRPAR